MKLQSTPPRPPAPKKGLIPIDFNKIEKDRENEQNQDWGMNPNPEGYRPNFKLMGGCAACGVASGAGLGILGSGYLGIPAFPLVAAGCLAGAYLGGAIGLAFSNPDPK